MGRGPDSKVGDPRVPRVMDWIQILLSIVKSLKTTSPPLSLFLTCFGKKPTGSDWGLLPTHNKLSLRSRYHQNVEFWVEVYLPCRGSEVFR